MAKGAQGTGAGKTKMKVKKAVSGTKMKASSAGHPSGKPRVEKNPFLRTHKLTSTGQHQIISSGCISTRLDGKPCPNSRAQVHIPYCKSCMRTGDPSLRPVKHPKFGKILIATRALKKGYTVAWWGKRVSKKNIPEKNMEWALETPKGYGMIDAVPCKEGSQLQFSACPGPSERPTIDFDPYNQVVLLCREPQTCLVFKTLCDIPKSHQVTMMYNEDEKTTDEFFKERGLVRADVGTKAYPALKKKSRAK